MGTTCTQKKQLAKWTIFEIESDGQSPLLTHWDQDKMADISKTTNALFNENISNSIGI